MPDHMIVELDVPNDIARFALPAGVQQRLQFLLDKQDRTGSLSPGEREEAEGLVDVSELLSFLRSRCSRG